MQASWGCLYRRRQGRSNYCSSSTRAYAPSGLAGRICSRCPGQSYPPQQGGVGGIVRQTHSRANQRTAPPVACYGEVITAQGLAGAHTAGSFFCP